MRTNRGTLVRAHTVSVNRASVNRRAVLCCGGGWCGCGPVLRGVKEVYTVKQRGRGPIAGCPGARTRTRLIVVHKCGCVNATHAVDICENKVVYCQGRLLRISQTSLEI
jgi:hypothetical protein